MIGRVVLAAVAFWAIAMMFCFLISSVVSAWPLWLELPWSGFDDFVVTPNGQVVVYTSFFQRLLVYDLGGRFRSSLPGVRVQGQHELAVDVRGRVYVRARPWLCVTETLVADEYSLACRAEPVDAEVGWKLDESGVPEAVVLRPSPGLVPDRAVGEGECLFGPGRRSHRRFQLAGGGWVERVHDHLVVQETTAGSSTIATPWYLYWAKFPFPGALAWLLAFAIGFAERWLIRGGRRAARPETGDGSRP